MPTQIYAGVTVDVNEQGYLAEHDPWSDAVGTAIAEELGITLTTEHWEVLNFARAKLSVLTTGWHPLQSGGRNRATVY